MSPRARIALVAAAVAAAVVAFVLLQPGDDDEADTAGDGSVATAPAETAPRGEPETRGDTGEGEGERETETDPEARPDAELPEPPAERDDIPQIVVRQQEPVGGVRELSFESGERVRFEVDVDAPYEVHVHGYDIIERATPDRPARFSFDADAQGIFEVELEGPHTEIAELRVEP